MYINCLTTWNFGQVIWPSVVSSVRANLHGRYFDPQPIIIAKTPYKPLGTNTSIDHWKLKKYTYARKTSYMLLFPIVKNLPLIIYNTKNIKILHITTFWGSTFWRYVLPHFLKYNLLIQLSFSYMYATNTTLKMLHACEIGLQNYSTLSFNVSLLFLWVRKGELDKVLYRVFRKHPKKLYCVMGKNKHKKLYYNHELSRYGFQDINM